MPAPTFTAQIMAALGRLKLFLTAALPSSPPTGLLVYDTTTDGVKVANNAGVFTAVGGGGGGVTVGAAVTGGVVNAVLFDDAAGNVGANANFTYVPASGIVLGAGVIQVLDGTKAAPSIRSATAQNGLSFTSNSVDVDSAGGVVTRLSASVGPYTGSGNQFGFASGADCSLAGPDTGIGRAAAGVLRTTNGGVGTAWLQIGSGELALNGNYTNATAGFTNTVLSATVLSGRTYSFECCLFFDDSTAADGAQFDFNGGTAAATNFRAQAFAVNNVGASLVLTNGAVTALATAIQVALALTTQTMIVIRGTFVPSGAGTFIVRAAQTAHSTGTLTVDRGSYLTVRDANPL